MCGICDRVSKRKCDEVDYYIKEWISVEEKQREKSTESDDESDVYLWVGGCNECTMCSSLMI